ncbi:MAG: O-methyltransferase [Lachnospiraceae bacterium]|nr:O-methyltransferase [Lachnospiraceae bacterium]
MDLDRTAGYIDSLDKGNSKLLNDLEVRAKQDGVPIIRRPMQSFLRTLLKVKQPSRILEIGTAVGFSALLMAENTDKTEIVTIEKFEKRYLEAKENIAASPYKDRIELIFGDALEVLDEMALRGESFDFIFMDAAKGQYPGFLEPSLKLLCRDGVLLADNVLKDGDIIESKFALTRRDRTIHKRMRDYLYQITHSDILETAILPVGDGAALSVKTV